MTYLLFAVALSLSAVAAWYAIAGLVAIFAAAAVPIMIMGSLLEASKLVVASWLYRSWKEIPKLMKAYFLIALIILMALTSMGIFGFLSKAHLDQTASSFEAVARVEQIDKEIGRQNDLIKRAEDRLNRIETSGVGADANVQRQIDAEQGRIESSYDRVQSAITEQQRIIDGQIKLFQDELTNIDQELATLQGYIDTNDIRKAQAMVGTRVDGQYGPATAAAFQRWQTTKKQERSRIIAKIESANTNPTVKAARDEIQRIRKGVEVQITESNKLINRLRSQLGQTDASEVEALLTEQRNIITKANADVDVLTSQKYELQAETRKLEAEVGPIKYIAALIYGDSSDVNLLESAVRFMILMIVFVFDPLAVLMLVAANWQMRKDKEGDKVTPPVEPAFKTDPVKIVETQPVENPHKPLPEEAKSVLHKFFSKVNVEDKIKVEPQIEPKTIVQEVESLQHQEKGVDYDSVGRRITP